MHYKPPIENEWVLWLLLVPASFIGTVTVTLMAECLLVGFLGRAVILAVSAFTFIFIGMSLAPRGKLYAGGVLAALICFLNIASFGGWYTVKFEEFFLSQVVGTFLAFYFVLRKRTDHKT